MKTRLIPSSGSLHSACSGRARDHAIVMAYDAFRMSLVIPTRTFTPKQVMRWLRLMQKPQKTMIEIPTPTIVQSPVDTSLLNDPDRLRERAEAIDAAANGKPVDKWCDGKWIELKEISDFFYDRRYRARPTVQNAAGEATASEQRR